jgi:hypothetical protein
LEVELGWRKFGVGSHANISSLGVAILLIDHLRPSFRPDLPMERRRAQGISRVA